VCITLPNFCSLRWRLKSVFCPQCPGSSIILISASQVATGTRLKLHGVAFVLFFRVIEKKWTNPKAVLRKRIDIFLLNWSRKKRTDYENIKRWHHHVKGNILNNSMPTIW
jgi:hypothetical protein